MDARWMRPLTRLPSPVSRASRYYQYLHYSESVTYCTSVGPNMGHRNNIIEGDINWHDSRDKKYCASGVETYLWWWGHTKFCISKGSPSLSCNHYYLTGRTAKFEPNSGNCDLLSILSSLTLSQLRRGSLGTTARKWDSNIIPVRARREHKGDFGAYRWEAYRSLFPSDSPSPRGSDWESKKGKKSLWLPAVII